MTTQATISLNAALAQVEGYIDDGREGGLNLKQAQIMVAGETETGATFVSHIDIKPEQTIATSSWNDFDFYQAAAATITDYVQDAVEESKNVPDDQIAIAVVDEAPAQ